MKDFSTRLLSTTEHAQWNSFVAAQQNGKLFHTTSWLSLYGSDIQIAAAFSGDDMIAGIAAVPFTKMKVRGFHNLPFTPYYGFLTADSIAKDADALNMVVAPLLKTLPPSKVHDFTLVPGHHHIHPWAWEKFDINVYVTYTIAPGWSEQEYLERISAGKKRDLATVRKLLINGTIELRTGKQLAPEIAALVGESSQRIGYRNPMDVLNKLITLDQIHCIAVYHKELGLLSGNILFEDHAHVYNLFNGSKRIKDPKLTLVNVLNMFESVRYASDRNKTFDFEGSMLKGVEKFYRAMGGTEMPVYRCSRSSNVLLEVGKAVYKHLN